MHRPYDISVLLRPHQVIVDCLSLLLDTSALLVVFVEHHHDLKIPLLHLEGLHHAKSARVEHFYFKHDLQKLAENSRSNHLNSVNKCQAHFSDLFVEAENFENKAFFVLPNLSV